MFFDMKTIQNIWSNEDYHDFSQKNQLYKKLILIFQIIYIQMKKQENY